MSQNYQQGAGKAPRKPIINKWEGEGIVRPRSGNAEDEIKFFPFQKGGGAIHITVACSELSSGADENGQPRTVTCYVPVSVMTNKLITEQQLKGVRPGMKVHVVGRLQPESYTSKKTGNKVTTMVVSAFVFEILEMPQQGYQSQYPQQGVYPQQGGIYPPQGQYYPQQGMYPPPQGGYPPQGGMYPPQGGYPQQQGMYPPQQQVPYQGQQPGYVQQAGGNPPTPPYYQPPGFQGGVQGAPAAPSGGVTGDLPPGPGETINV